MLLLVGVLGFFLIMIPLSDDSKTIVASARISNPEDDSTRIEFDIKVRNIASALSSIDFDGTIDLLHYSTSNPFLTANISLKGSIINADIPIALVYQNDNLTGDSRFELSYKLKSDKLVVKTKLELHANQKEILIRVFGNISWIPGSFVSTTSGAVADTWLRKKAPIEE